jgi:hypothetical protein
VNPALAVVNGIGGVILWYKLSVARGKGILATVLCVLLPIIGIPYLAFSE